MSDIDFIYQGDSPNKVYTDARRAAIEKTTFAQVTADPALSIEIDEGETYTYVGRALPGTATSAAAWQVTRITNATGSSRLANSGRFTQIWNNRSSLTYA